MLYAISEVKIKKKIVNSCIGDESFIEKDVKHTVFKLLCCYCCCSSSFMINPKMFCSANGILYIVYEIRNKMDSNNGNNNAKVLICQSIFK